LFQNPVGFETTSWKSGQMPAFPCKSKVAVPKTEVLEQPRISEDFMEDIDESVLETGGAYAAFAAGIMRD
jgi:hypothetical protein